MAISLDCPHGQFPVTSVQCPEFIYSIVFLVNLPAQREQAAYRVPTKGRSSTCTYISVKFGWFFGSFESFLFALDKMFTKMSNQYPFKLA